MAGISNIIGAYNVNPKRVSSKLSFEVGQVFAAKIVSSGELNKELILKLLDGWQFTAKLQNPLEFIPEGLTKFQVEGFQDGKLQIKIIKNKDEKQELDKSSLEDLISEGSIDVSKDDYEILKKMVKHNMPLTKENITQVKTLVDFREKLIKSDEEADSFILKYANSKNIDIDSAKGKEIGQNLKSFFNELKNISEDELLTMLENGIEVNEENIKSFTKIFRDESSIYKELKEVSEKLNLQGVLKVDDTSKETEVFEIQENSIKNSGSEKSEDYSIGSIIKRELQKSNISSEEAELYKNLKKLMNNEVDTPALKSITKEELEAIPENEIENASDETVDAKVGTDKERLKLVEDKSKHIAKFDKETIESAVKEQFTNKTEEIKNIIKSLISEEKSLEPASYNKVLQTLKESINDFKVFNSVSNQYYCLDIPVNLNKDEYQCKLLIKDDRKSGKKIDSKNISLVVSVKTLGIGVVDAYIKIRDNSMNVDIKSDEDWVKILSSGKDIILRELSGLGYNVHFSVDKKEVEANLTNCREFFQDNGIGSINVRV
jgi:uncharacterized protein YutE (UPF0331/DUF86 family)